MTTNGGFVPHRPRPRPSRREVVVFCKRGLPPRGHGSIIENRAAGTEAGCAERLMETPETRPTGVRVALRWAWRICRVLLIAYLVVVAASMFMENQLIFFPTRYPGGVWKPEGLEYEDAWFSSADGVRLHGWHVPHDNPRAVILFCHGNAGNVTHRASVLKILHDYAGASVMIFDYRGYGRSEGKPSGPGVLADARAARAWLAEREQIPESVIVLLGESIGGAVAVDLAARDGARGLVLESTFDALPEVAAYHYPWLPVRWAMRTRLDSASIIGRYRGPLLQAHGDADAIVPLQLGRRLFDAAGEPKRFVLLPGHDHNDPM
ncbi:MAG: alpha/beta hydrolase, partial [Pirellulaceae bacterium]|nr:alpha/beta hydrolase [Pirellulaceae bacterium]